MSFLEIQEVDSYYGKSKILNDVALRVDEGEIVALMGRNGVGKTTTLKTIMGIVAPNKGKIVWQDNNVAGNRPHKIARQGIGYVPEERRIFPRLTVKENLLMGTRAMKGRKQLTSDWDFERIYSVFPVLKDKTNLLGESMSGGEQQMLTMARTLMGNPSMLLVDEPTEGLAPLIRKDVANELQEINRQGVSILLVEQNMQVALSLAQRGYIMSKGCVVFSGSSQDILENDDVRRKYLEV